MIRYTSMYIDSMNIERKIDAPLYVSTTKALPIAIRLANPYNIIGKLRIVFTILSTGLVHPLLRYLQW